MKTATHGVLVLRSEAPLSASPCVAVFAEQGRRVTLVAAMVVSVWLAAATPARAGTIVAWGRDDYGQVSGVPDGDDFIAISAGGNFSLGLRSDGSIAAWGGDGAGQVSNAPAGTGFTAIGAGGETGLALASDGSIVAWGSNGYNMVTDAPTDDGYTAFDVTTTGNTHAHALTSDGSIVSWGRDYWGQCELAPTDAGYIAVAAGEMHGLAMKSDGSIVGWSGYNWAGQATPPAGTGFTALSADLWHSMALDSDGSIVCWGWNDVPDGMVPPDGDGFTAASCGGKYNLALASDGSITAWGDDGAGQCSGAPDVTAALLGPGLNPAWGDPGDPNPWYGAAFVAIAAGGEHSLALTFALPLVWDADTDVPDDGAQDGNGTWIDGGDNWCDEEGNVIWDNTKKAIACFGAGDATADLTVTVDAVTGVTAGGIVFDEAGGHRYTLTGGTITLEGSAPTIEANVDARIESVIDAGTAGLTKTGPGTLELTGANTYSGTAVAGGTLVGYAGVGGTGSILGDVALSNDSNVTFDQGSDATYDGMITGDGSVTKTGAGTLEVTSDDHEYTGGTTVSAGTLRVSGWLPADSTVTVEDGGTLGGDGRAAAIDLLRGGTLAPGESVGTLIADGEVTLGAGAAYEWEVNDLDGTTAGADWDLLHISGFDLIVSATSGDPFSIKVISLDSLGDPGTAGGTLEEGDSFEIVAYAARIVGFSADAFDIDTTAFENAMAGLGFVVAERTGSLYLDVVPEPATLALLGLGLGGLLLRRRGG